MSVTKNPFKDPHPAGETSSSISTESFDLGAEICQELETWMIEFGNAQKPYPKTLYQLSSAWDGIGVHIWSRFDDLEARTIARHQEHAGAQPPPWHQSAL